MVTWRTSLWVLSFSVGLWALTNPVLAQSFDDRWSIVPKAKADEPVAQPAPQGKEQPNSQPEVRTPAETVGQAERSAP